MVGRSGIDAVIDAVQPSRQHRRTSEVWICRGVYHAVFNAPWPGHTDHLRPVRTAIGDVDRRPGGAGTRSPADQALVAIHRRGQDRAERRRMLQDAAHEPAALGRETERIVLAVEEVFLAS